MKKITLLFLLVPLVNFAQWTQLGNTVAGESASDRAANVSLSSDGTVMAIGARYNNGNGTKSGHVRVFGYEANQWIQIGEDINGEAIDDLSGQALSLSGDGTTVAIGALFNDGNGRNSGHVRIFKNVNGTWNQIGADIDGEALANNSGGAVSINHNGTIVAIGARYNDANGIQDTGHVRVYQNNKGVWEQLGNDIDGAAFNNFFGTSVAISADGYTVAIGAPYNNNKNGKDAGHVQVYQYTSGSWAQIGDDINGEAEDDNSGEVISLSDDGSTIAIGARSNDGNGSNSGHVRVYKNISEVWTQLGNDIDGPSSNKFFPSSLSLNADGTTLAIGASFVHSSVVNSGTTHVMNYKANSWSLVETVISGANENDYSGFSVSISNDGNTVAIGSELNNDNGVESGHVRVLTNSQVLSSSTFNAQNFKAFPNPTQNNVQINLGNNYANVQLTITNAIGQTIFQKHYTNTNILTPTIYGNSGVYFMEINTSTGKNEVLKIVKQD